MINTVEANQSEKYKLFCEHEKCNLGFSEDLLPLGQPVKLGVHTVHNRIVYHPMEGCDGTRSGSPDELTIRRYHRFAAGGMGILWFEATACMEKARANPRQLWIQNENLDDFKRLVYDIKSICMKENGFEPIIIMQNTHSGRYSKPNGFPEPIITRNNTLFEKDNPIDSARIITDDELDEVRDALVNNARLAELAGFDGVDIKCCHGYLNNELFSGYNRTGRYGGSLENRSRLLMECIRGIKEAAGKNFIVTTRFNVYDGFPYPCGFGVAKDGSTRMDLTEPKQILSKLYDAGVRLVNITMGNPYVNPHVNRPFKNGAYIADEPAITGVERLLNGCAELSSEFDDFLMVCSGLSYLGEFGPNVAADFIARNAFTFAGFGRQIFSYPDIAREIIKNGEIKRDKCCIACGKCSQVMRAGGTPGCVIRDSAIYLPIFKEYCKM